MRHPTRLRLMLSVAATMAAQVAAPELGAQTLPPLAGQALREGCAVVTGVLPPGCEAPQAGDVIARPAPPNVETPAPPAVGGDYGFSISIDGVATEGEAAAPILIAGDAPIPMDPVRAADRMIDAAGLQVRFDGLGVRPILNVATADLRRSYAAGDTVTFRASSNYPAWIAGAEVRVIDRATGRPVATVPIAPNGTADWAMPATGPAEMTYVLRVTDSAGRFDETAPLPLARSDLRQPQPALDGLILATGEGEDRTARRGIPVRGGAVTVSGAEVPAGARVTVMGETVPVAGPGFAVQRILPPGQHGVRIAVAGPGVVPLDVERSVTVPRAEWFVTGLADLTLGRDLGRGETFTRGHLAGFADGTLAGGTRITASVDTGEGPLGDLGFGYDRHSPAGLLRAIEPQDVFAVTGDDSLATDLAPSSDGLYLRVENGADFAMYGDFRAWEGVGQTVRGDRTLTGFAANLERGRTAGGEPRLRLGVYAAQPDTLVGRDVLSATGGSAYLLSRRDLEPGGATVTVELRDPASGRVVESRRLAEGTDYRFDAMQGAVILREPLAPTAPAGDLVADSALGDLDVVLVVQYEYVPLRGEVDGLTAGGRAEAWVGDGLRLGLSGVTDDSGAADTTMVGADLLWQRSEGTFLRADVARSEGPGFGRSLSRDGGLTFVDDPAEGIVGEPAGSVRVEGRLDFADLGGDGFLAVHLDRQEAGFSSPERDVATDRMAWGIEGESALRPGLRLTFGADAYAEDAADGGPGPERTDLRVGARWQASPRLTFATEIAATDRTDPGTADGTGRRTDLGLRADYALGPDATLALFGQGTLALSGDLVRNDRLGVGLSRRFSDALTFDGEVSDGTRGPAGLAQLTWTPAPGRTYALGFRRDAERRPGDPDLGRDGGSLVASAERAASDRLTTRVETVWTGWGATPSVVSTYGLTYTPSDAWAFDGGLVSGTRRESDGTETDRQGLTFGLRHADGDRMSATLRTELIRTAAGAGDETRQAILSGSVDRRASDSWRALGQLDLVLTEDDDDAFRDGRYVELRFGAAYRPVAHDRTNALLSFTWLDDRPGPDQRNIDGDVDGDLQRSRILNAALTRDLTPRWTLGLKYGFRLRDQAPRATEIYATSRAHLLVARLDYHVVHNWDVLLEARALRVEEDATQLGALVGVYRHVGPNLRLGLGYQWGRTSDDLRRIADDREGVTRSLVGSF